MTIVSVPLVTSTSVPFNRVIKSNRIPPPLLSFYCLGTPSLLPPPFPSPPSPPPSLVNKRKRERERERWYARIPLVVSEQLLRAAYNSTIQRHVTKIRGLHTFQFGTMEVGIAFSHFCGFLKKEEGKKSIIISIISSFSSPSSSVSVVIRIFPNIKLNSLITYLDGSPRMIG